MLQPFATAFDVAARWRPLTDTEQAVADVLIGDASAMVRSRWPDVDQRVESGALAEADVLRVVAAMVKRAMINGPVEGVEQQSQAAGPFSLSQRFTNPNANLYFTAEDLRLFDPEGARTRAVVGWLA